MKTDPFVWYFLIFWIVVRIIRRPYYKMSRQKQVVDSRAGLLESFLMTGTMLTMMILPPLFVFTSILDDWNYTPFRLLSVLGVFITILSLWLFWRSHKDLGDNWSVSLHIREDHKLVRNGIYARVRHPMYAALWLWVISQALLLPNWVTGLSPILAFGCMYFVRVRSEEAMLREHFGEAFDDYANRTGRLIPRFR